MAIPQLTGFIFTEGSVQWGTGHIQRCLSFHFFLLQAGINPIWFVDGDDSIDALFAFYQIEYTKVDWKSPDFINNIAHSKPCIIIVDSYHADFETYSALSNKTKRCIWIDDFARLNYPQGFVLNSNPLVKQNSSHNSIPLIGFSYQPIRSQILRRKEITVNKIARNVLILIGGSDPRNLSERVLWVILNEFPQLYATAIISEETTREKLKSSFPDSKILPLQSPENLRELIENSDFAITGGGQTICETAHLGLPTLCIGIAENQRYNIKAVEEANAVHQICWHDDSQFEEKCKSSIDWIQSQSVRHQLSEAGTLLIDGLGTSRACREAFDWSNNFQLENVLPNDIESIWKLSNDAAVRAASIQSAPIPWDDHVRWFQIAINRPDVLFLIVRNPQLETVGQLRYNHCNASATVSISLTSNARGKGESHKLLKEGDCRCFSLFPSIEIIEAEIWSENIASQKAFLRAGYTFSGNTVQHEQRIFHKFTKSRNNV